MGDRKHLTGIEVERLIAAIKGSRNEKRDRCLVLLMYRHGLRVSEACGVKGSKAVVCGKVEQRSPFP
jgi:integrase